MFIYKILLKFLRYTDNDLSAFVPNPDFPTTTPDIATIAARKHDFDVAVANAANGGKVLKEIRTEKRILLEMAMRLLASYVEDNSNNTKSIMLEAGFSVHGGPVVHRTYPDTPIIRELTYGRLTLTADVKVIPVENTDVYEFRFTEDPFGPEARWTNLPVSTKSTFTITGITYGSNIWAQVRCHNSIGISNWSDPAQLVLVH